MEKILYEAQDKYSESSYSESFQLHNHDEYEIFVFLDGDSEYVVEEKTYNLSRGDVIIIRKHEMHRVFHKSNKPYHRFVIMVSPDFFPAHSCAQYENAFSGSTFTGANKIPAQIVRSSGIYDALLRLKEYSDSFESLYTPVCDAILVEILYLINKISDFEKGDTRSILVKNIISYINEHYTEELSLEALSEAFYISRFHLCRVFKDATGLTIKEYVTQKRLLHATELVRRGKSLTDASGESGFPDYSAFYRARKKYGQI